MFWRTVLAAALVGSLITLIGCGQTTPESPAPSKPTLATTEASVVEKPNVDETAAPLGYIGSERCQHCHTRQAQAFENTAHQQAIAAVDTSLEPPDGEFFHAKSGRKYRVYRRDGELRHREWLGSDDDSAAIVADYPVKYCVGSGHHSRTYLAEIDGFLVESPITWYASRQAWGVSPGYDLTHPASFERAADLGCLNCHVSQAEAIDNSYHRINFLELGIGCERCHGPGDHHARLHESPKGDHLANSQEIIHPAKLSRTLTEAICSQCHLRGDATVFHPGESPATYRPGRPLNSVRIDYRATNGSHDMTVVGHMEQMWLSRCYTQSTELTCISCHEVHGSTSHDPEAVRQHSRSQCLSCHSSSACGLPMEDSQRLKHQNDCLFCHMPQTETDIPHLAFTHHRIAVHPAELRTTRPDASDFRLEPIADLSNIPTVWQDRAYGLALLECAPKQKDPKLRQALISEGQSVLLGLIQRQSVDGDVLSNVAQGIWRQNPAQSLPLAEEAFRRPETGAGQRANAALMITDSLLTLHRQQAAQQWATQLTQMRRHSSDWALRAETESQPDATMAAWKQAVSIQPFRPDLQRRLMEELQARRLLSDADRVEKQLQTLLKSDPAVP